MSYGKPLFSIVVFPFSDGPIASVRVGPFFLPTRAKRLSFGFRRCNPFAPSYSILFYLLILLSLESAFDSMGTRADPVSTPCGLPTSSTIFPRLSSPSLAYEIFLSFPGLGKIF